MPLSSTFKISRLIESNQVTRSVFLLKTEFFTTMKLPVSPIHPDLTRNLPKANKKTKRNALPNLKLLYLPEPWNKIRAITGFYISLLVSMNGTLETAYECDLCRYRHVMQNTWSTTKGASFNKHQSSLLPRRPESSSRDVAEASI